MSVLPPNPSWQRKAITNYVVNDPLAVIYNEGEWRLNKVSPLHNLDYNSVNLKQYNSTIQQVIINTISTTQPTKYKVTCSVEQNLKFADYDPDALKICVTSQTKNSSQPKKVYLAYFISWGNNQSVANATYLPHMLERGERKLGVAIKSSLQNTFDCNITEISFTQTQLLLFGFIFIENTSSRPTENFVLSYTKPEGNVKNTLDLRFEIGDMDHFWKGAKDENTEKIKLVTEAYRILQNQIMESFLLDVSQLQLCEVKLLKAVIKSNGTVKMKTPEIVNSVLTVLNETSNCLYESTSVDDNFDSDQEEDS